MTNYLDEYNKRMTMGPHTAPASTPLGLQAQFDADRARQQQQASYNTSAPVSMGNTKGLSEIPLLKVGFFLFVAVCALSLGGYLIEEVGGGIAIPGFALAIVGGISAMLLAGVLALGILARVLPRIGSVIAHKLTLTAAGVFAVTAIIVYNIYAPAALYAGVIGAALVLARAIKQKLSKN